MISSRAVPLPHFRCAAREPFPLSTPFLDAFRSRRVWLLVALGFASGLPLPLTGATLVTWMKNEGVDLATIGAFALVGLPYSLKFLWAPALDRYSVGFLGRRRGWMALLQIGLALGIAALGFLPREAGLAALAALALAVAFLSASHDVVVDAYRTDILPEEERGSGTATFVMGYRFGLVLSGAVALMLSDSLGWPVVYGLMAALMGVGLLATLLAPEPEGIRPPRTLVDAVVRPFSDYFRREGAILTLAFLVLYKLGDAIAGLMITPFLLELGFTNSEIGVLNKGLGMGATLVGALLGGGLVSRLGLRRALFAFGILQAATNASYMALAVVGKSYPVLVISLVADNLTGGLGTAAFVAFLMSLCHRSFSATQYALLSSLSSVGGRLFGAGSGALAASIGWPAFFAATIAAAAPALLLLGRLPPGLAAPRPAPAEPAQPRMAAG